MYLQGTLFHQFSAGLTYGIKLMKTGALLTLCKYARSSPAQSLHTSKLLGTKQVGRLIVEREHSGSPTSVKTSLLKHNIMNRKFFYGERPPPIIVYHAYLVDSKPGLTVILYSDQGYKDIIIVTSAGLPSNMFIY